MGFKVKQAAPGVGAGGWPLQPALSRKKNSDLGVRRVGGTVIYSLIIYLFILHSLPG